jgi:hypothetical protein
MGRVYRRVCFLRSEGRAVEAKRLQETELAAARAEVVGAEGPEAEAKMKVFFAQEEERVAGAIAFSELLLPELEERIAALKPEIVAPPSLSRPPLTRAPGFEHGIADFIDEMLAQERAGAH